MNIGYDEYNISAVIVILKIFYSIQGSPLARDLCSLFPVQDFSYLPWGGFLWVPLTFSLFILTIIRNSSEHDIFR